jgi:hypothetical protein
MTEDTPMTEQERKEDFEWLLKMLALEEQKGEIVPGGAVGGMSRQVRAAARAEVSVAMRARSRVRYLARAVPGSKEKAA